MPYFGGGRDRRSVLVESVIGDEKAIDDCAKKQLLQMMCLMEPSYV
jgi:hypothetical protein